MRTMLILFLLAGLLLVALTLAQLAEASGNCLTRDEAITLIAHKSDIEHGNPAWVKARIWQIAERESGMQHCWTNGTIKENATHDHGLLQLNERGVWRNCAVNPHCRRDWMIDDAAAQVDVMLNYLDKYGDLCPWNPAGDYAPGCGYR